MSPVDGEPRVELYFQNCLILKMSIRIMKVLHQTPGVSPGVRWARKDGTMRRFILAAGLAVLCLTAWSAPADGAVPVTPAPVTPSEADGRTDVGWPADAGGRPSNWLREFM